MDLRPGWLSRQFEANAIEIATWPESMRASAGFTDEGMTERQRKEAARILRKRGDELDPPTEVPAKDAGPSDAEMFEAWAGSKGYDLTTHPLHYLFLDQKTYHARQGWKAAIHAAMKDQR
jgi:hypothetical protein